MSDLDLYLLVLTLECVALLSGGLFSRATDFGSGNVRTRFGGLRSECLLFRATDFGLDVYLAALALCTREVYTLVGSTPSGYALRVERCTYSLCGSTRWGSTVSGYRVRIWICTYSLWGSVYSLGGYSLGLWISDLEMYLLALGGYTLRVYSIALPLSDLDLYLLTVGVYILGVYTLGVYFLGLRISDLELYLPVRKKITGSLQAKLVSGKHDPYTWIMLS